MMYDRCVPAGDLLGVSELMQAHRALCTSFVSEELFRRALGGNRADLGTIVRYLQMPLRERPALSLYFDRAFYLGTQPQVCGIRDRPAGPFHPDGHGRIAVAPSARRSGIHRQSRMPIFSARSPSIDGLVDLLEYDLAAPSPYFDPREYRDRLGSAAPGHGMLRHFLTKGLAAGVCRTRISISAWYAAQYADVPKQPYAALRHFILLGDVEARRAGPQFDGQLYRSRYEDVAAAGVRRCGIICRTAARRGASSPAKPASSARHRRPPRVPESPCRSRSIPMRSCTPIPKCAAR